MIRLEHINLVVKNLDQAVAFYQAAFPHWRVRQKGKSDWYGKDRQWLHFGDDTQYLTFNDSGEGDNRNLKGHQLGVAHFAFEISNIASLKQRMKTAGYEIANPGAGNEYRDNVYYIDCDGFEVEFVEYKSDIPDLRNNEV